MALKSTDQKTCETQDKSKITTELLKDVPDGVSVHLSLDLDLRLIKLDGQRCKDEI